MWNVETNFAIKIGGICFINVPNLIVSGGENLFRVKRREEDGLLAIDFDVYLASGEKVATVRSAHIVGKRHDDYHYQKEKHRYWVTEKSSGRIICDVRQATKATEGSEIQIDVDLYSKSGFHIIATPFGTTIPGYAHMRGMTIADCGTGLVAP